MVMADQKKELSIFDSYGGPVNTWLDLAIADPIPIMVSTLDVGAKCMIVGSSKCRKSFFIMQMAISFATGRQFLNWTTRQTKTVMINLEIPRVHSQKRLQRMAASMGVTSNELENLTTLDVRGREFNVNDPRFIDWVAANGFGAVIFDPLYKVLTDGDENSAQDVKPYLATFDRIAEKTGAAIIFTHHCAKGTPGERAAIDRGAGSGVLARDYDTGIYLNEHAEDGMLACETIVRAYPPQDPFSLLWGDGHFVVDTAEAVIKTSATRNRNDAPPISSAFAAFCQLNKTVPKTEAVELLRQIGFSRRAARDAIKELEILGKLQEKQLRFPNTKIIGIPGAMMTYLNENPEAAK